MEINLVETQKFNFLEKKVNSLENQILSPAKLINDSFRKEIQQSCEKINAKSLTDRVDAFNAIAQKVVDSYALIWSIQNQEGKIGGRKIGGRQRTNLKGQVYMHIEKTL